MVFRFVGVLLNIRLSAGFVKGLLSRKWADVTKCTVGHKSDLCTVCLKVFDFGNCVKEV